MTRRGMSRLLRPASGAQQLTSAPGRGTVLRPLAGGARSVGVIAAAEGLGGFLGAAVALRVKPRRMLLAGWATLPLMSLWVLAYVVPGTLSAVLAGAVVGLRRTDLLRCAYLPVAKDQV